MILFFSLFFFFFLFRKVAPGGAGLPVAVGRSKKKKKRSIPVAPDVGLWAARGQVPLVRARRIGRCVRGSPFFENTIQKWGPKII